LLKTPHKGLSCIGKYWQLELFWREPEGRIV